MTNEGKLKYKDEKGDILYGYSQLDLKQNTYWVKALVYIFTVWTIIAIWLIYYVMAHDVLNNYIFNCI